MITRLEKAVDQLNDLLDRYCFEEQGDQNCKECSMHELCEFLEDLRNYLARED